VKNAQVMANTLMERGFKIVSGGTKNHLMLVDLIGRDISGKDAEAVLGRANITVNKNMVPNDPRSPFITSGLRLGTPAITTRGFKEKETQQVAHALADILTHWQDESVIAQVKQKMLDLCQQFPVYDANLWRGHPY